jgi:asparagine synthase (glutamine-hydrolysing)
MRRTSADCTREARKPCAEFTDTCGSTARPSIRARLRRWGALTVHRGPDDAGVHVDGACAIGMRRCRSSNVAGGHQPLKSADGKIWLVCNGEIYNFRELRSELEARGHRFLTRSDCEVIIPLYRELGDRLVDRLNGMFGFALWDAERRRLLVGRDRLGIKPLYTWSDGRHFAFASEAKALFALPGVVPALDEDTVAGYLQLGYVAAPRTIFRGVRKLAPATVVTVADGRISERRYWQISGEIDRARTVDEWAARIRAQIEQSVAMQMVSDVPIGAFLSGGIDSSAVVGLMSRHSSGPVKTYSIGFGGSGADDFYNELPYAKTIATRFATDHHEILVKPDVVGLLPRLLWLWTSRSPTRRSSRLTWCRSSRGATSRSSCRGWAATRSSAATAVTSAPITIAVSRRFPDGRAASRCAWARTSPPIATRRC